MSTVELDVAMLSAWVAESRVTARPDAMRAARAAMHVAVRTSRTASVVRARPAVAPRRVWEPLLRRPYRLRLAASSMAVAAVVVIAAGWNAGAGSPLHVVQQAREDAGLVTAGGSQAASLRLSYAEERLRAASAGTALRDNLAEATSLINSARADLPANHADPLWLRWERDSEELIGLAAPRASTPATSAGDEANAASTGGAPGGNGDGGRSSAGASPSGDGERGHGGSTDGGDGGPSDGNPGGALPSGSAGGGGDDGAGGGGSSSASDGTSGGGGSDGGSSTSAGTRSSGSESGGSESSGGGGKTAGTGSNGGGGGSSSTSGRSTISGGDASGGGDGGGSRPSGSSSSGRGSSTSDGGGGR